MKRLNCNITIGDLTATFVRQFQIESSWDKFTDTATIEFPRDVIIKKELKRIEDIISVGDNVTISAGYFPNAEKRFTGFVSKIEPDVVTKIHCQDGAWLCKRESLSFSEQSINVSELVSKYKPDGLGVVSTIDANIGSLRVNGLTFSQVMENIRKTFGLRTWFNGLDLFCGLPYTQQSGKTHDISFQRDIPLGQSNLIYKNSDDIKLKIRAVSIQPDNSKIETTVGDENGEQRTFNAFNVGSVSDLKKLAEQHLDDLKFTGFRGDFTIFGEPFVTVGDSIVLTDELNPNRGDGLSSYGVKSVSTSFSVDSGFRQIVELGKKGN